MKTPPHQRFGGYKVFQGINEFADALVYSAIVVFMLVRPFGIQTFVIPSGSMVDTLRLSDYIVANKWVYRTSNPEYGDIIVFKPPKDGLVPPATEEETDYIKRLIGKPGDVIEYKNKVLYRNGQVINEPYVDYTAPGVHNTMDEVLPKNEWDGVQLADYKLVQLDGKYWSVNMFGSYTNDGGYDAPGPAQQLAPVFKTTDPDLQKRLRDAPAAKIPEGYYLFMGDNRNGSYDGRAWGLVPRDSIVGKAWFIWMPVSRFKMLDVRPDYPDIKK
ncbi:MAG: signal peptidase I [Armatimonadetes bacterium]|nr:signal peptidase I [Armatimonadota bacterium]